MSWLRDLWNRLQDRYEWLDQRPYLEVRLDECLLRVCVGDTTQPVRFNVIQTWAHYAYGNMREAHPYRIVPWVNVRVRIVPGLDVQGRCKARDGVILMREGREEVIRHELYHYLGYKMHLPYWTTIDHPGGHNLDGTLKN